ncbi:MAG: DUF4920 domain-containing protein [Bryobacteraceae bacterium]|nr:DUF4920 domain-containing protein [Bryobacteraceae bacterium]MDW8377077.1 DUF4920 domain-containing protein [Bryobacterales bacterium]
MRRLLFPILACPLLLISGEKKLGKPLVLDQLTPIQALLAQPEQYVGKVVKVKGRATEVCEKMGCWTTLVDEQGNSIRIKVNDGEIVFPRSHVGKMVIAEGTFKKIVLSREQAVARARHEAEEQGRKFDPDSIRSGVTIYQIQGTGAVLLD